MVDVDIDGEMEIDSDSEKDDEEVMDVGVVIADANQRITHINEGFTRLTGYTANETVGQRAGFLQGKETDPHAVELIRNAVNSDSECRVVIVNYRKNGTPFLNLLTIYPITNSSRQPGTLSPSSSPSLSPLPAPGLMSASRGWVGIQMNKAVCKIDPYLGSFDWTSFRHPTRTFNYRKRSQSLCEPKKLKNRSPKSSFSSKASAFSSPSSSSYSSIFAKQINSSSSNKNLRGQEKPDSDSGSSSSNTCHSKDCIHARAEVRELRRQVAMLQNLVKKQQEHIASSSGCGKQQQGSRSSNYSNNNDRNDNNNSEENSSNNEHAQCNGIHHHHEDDHRSTHSTVANEAELNNDEHTKTTVACATIGVDICACGDTCSDTCSDTCGRVSESVDDVTAIPIDVNSDRVLRDMVDNSDRVLREMVNDSDRVLRELADDGDNLKYENDCIEDDNDDDDDSEDDEQAHVPVSNNKTVSFVSETNLPTEKGTFKVLVYKDYTKEHFSKEEEIVVVQYGDVANQTDIPCRVHDMCFTSEVLGSLKCDCKQQLEYAMEYIQKRKKCPHGGLIIYMPQEGRGIGLANKIKAYSMQELGLDTVDANRILGFEDDYREYQSVRAILHHLGVKSLQLMTNNPRKIERLKELGINITDRIPVLCETNSHSKEYLSAKGARMGHILT